MFNRISKWWRHFKRRMSYKNEAQALWREIGLHRMNQVLLEDLVREKQAKITRLQEYAEYLESRMGINPANPPEVRVREKPFASLQAYVSEYSHDFEARQLLKEPYRELDEEEH